MNDIEVRAVTIDGREVAEVLLSETGEQQLTSHRADVRHAVVHAIGQVLNLPARELRRAEVRAVGIERLDAVLDTGIDVDPPTGAFFSSGLEKALEYASFPKLVLFLDPAQVQSAWRWVSSDDVDAVKEARQAGFTDVLEVDNDTQLFMVVPHHQNPPNPGYDMAYRNWIPGDAPSALLAVARFVRRSDGPAV